MDLLGIAAAESSLHRFDHHRVPAHHMLPHLAADFEGEA